MIRALALAAALTLGACAFSSERAFFSERDAATPIADGARFTWREGPGAAAPMIVRYSRRGRTYDLTREDDTDPPMRVLFVAVRDTPEEDYIAQVAVNSEENGRLYAFMWREGEGYRLLLDPRGVEEGSPARAGLTLCSARPNGECQFRSRAALRDFYRRHIYPIYVVRDATPARYVDQGPVNAAPATEGKGA